MHTITTLFTWLISMSPLISNISFIVTPCIHGKVNISMSFIREVHILAMLLQSSMFRHLAKLHL